jgi:Kef-type K+ transport system membrane component KefB
LIFVVLAEKLGIEIIVGAFLAGAIVALLRTPEDRELSSQLEAIGFGFFIPIFFIMVGVDFNLPALVSSSEALLSVPLLLFAAIAVKIIPALVFRLNHTWREAFAAGILMCPRLSLIIAAAAIGEKLGIIDESVNAAIVLVAVVTVTASPLGFLRVFPAPRAKVARPPVTDTGLAAP